MERFWEAISDRHYSDNDRIQVYQTNFQAAKLKALDESFPLTKSLIGGSFFQAICQHFVHSFASVNDSLNQYGEEFPAFLKEIIPFNSGLLGKDYLVDSANLDWAVVQSYFAMDDDPAINWLPNQPSEYAFLKVANHVEYISYEHFWENDCSFASNATNNNEQLLAVSSTEFNRQLNESLKQNSQPSKHQALLVFRLEFEVQVMPLSSREESLFLLLRERTPLFLLEEKLVHASSPETISKIITKFKDAGILIGICEPNND